MRGHGCAARSLAWPGRAEMRPVFCPTARQLNVIIPVGLVALGYALYLRYLVIEQSSVGLACEAGAATWLCWSRAITITLFRHSVFGSVALGAAILNFARPSLVLFAVAIVAAGFGIVLYNITGAGVAIGLLILSLARPARQT